ncbi:Peptidase S41 family protein ustP [Colletotrichum siamense]|uniref:Peptidase S41 family protein ustP n=1 Tax=Colletotrichum siamense TaxID=690259 RepID=A0A9P5EYP6_COLSI|nr:Peptidase S41 family protein ustP [Colletotrichum siamense]KAF4861910.1 Peptidase S41 family protein ustP [Colletotrichum siamense]
MVPSILMLLPAVALVAADCAADNCIRALVATQTPGRLSSAQSFCTTFIAQSVASTDIPSFASHCSGDSLDAGAFSTRLSSACSCIGTRVPTVVPTSTSGPPPVTSTATTQSQSNQTASASFTTLIKPSTTPPADSPTPTEPCEVVSRSWASAFRGASPTVPAKVAYDCLKSVPLHKDAAIELVDSIRPYLEWQSDLAFLKSPPADYEPGPFDVVSHLEKVRANLEADKYDGELAFQEDLFALTAKARDGHFQFMPDALTGVFEYVRPFGLVSYSKDPTSLPVIKKWEEVGAKRDEARILTRLNGVNSSEYVQNIVETVAGNQDLDAAYNAMFFSRAKINAGSTSGLFRIGGWHKYLYPGENTTAEFATGETESAANIAVVKASFAGVTDGESFYQKFCAGNPSSLGTAASQPSTAENDQLEAALSSVVSTNDGKVSGFYLDAGDLEDVAVLSIPGFDPGSPRTFQKAVEEFLQACRSDGKSRIIIDLQMNPGGYVLSGIDLFRQFFPKIEQGGFSRWRENEQFMAMANIVSEAAGMIDPATSPSEEAVSWAQSWWNYRFDLDVSGKHFTSFDAKFAPNMWAGDPYTAVVRSDLSNNLTTANETFGIGIEVTGYGNRRNFTQPFKAENIILLTDGYCASTCSLFSSEMKRVGVKSVVVGGRPEKKPMQAVGGVKGAQVLRYSDIFNLTQEALTSDLVEVSAEQRASLQRLTDLPMRRSTEARLNVRDQILADNLEDGVPAQFVNEPADCRLFWTLDMMADVSEVWKAAANAAWGGASCASGGFEKGAITSKPTMMKATAARPLRESTVVSDAEPGHHVSEMTLDKHNQRVHIV